MVTFKNMMTILSDPYKRAKRRLSRFRFLNENAVGLDDRPGIAGRKRAVGFRFSALLAFALLVAVSAHAYAQDGPLPGVISGGADHAIKQWDGNGKLVATIGSHDDTVNALELIKGPMDLLASVGADGSLKIWSIFDHKQLTSIDAHKNGANCLSVGPGGTTIATGGGDNRIRLWNRVTRKMLADMPAHSGPVRGLQFTSDGAQLISGSADRMLRIWAVKPDLLVYQANIIAHDQTVTAVAISPDDKIIASISEDGYLKTWRLGAGGLMNRTRVGSHLNAVAFSPDGNTIATGGDDGKIKLWSVSNGASVLFTGGHDRAVYALAWSADGKTLVSGGADNKLRYWNVSNSRQMASIAAHDGAIKAIVIVP